MAADDCKPHLLIVDDANEIREPLARYLRGHNYRITTAADAAVARHVLKNSAIDLIILDVMMPGEDGMGFCRHIHETSQIPVIVLTALGDEANRIDGLDTGADDYLGKPFSPRELSARVAAVLRRAQVLPRQREQQARKVQFGEWILDTGQRELINSSGMGIPLSSGEYQLLTALLDHPLMALTRERLLDLTKDRHSGASGRSIDNQVSRLRHKLEPDLNNPRYIKTVWGGGYALAVQPVIDLAMPDESYA